MMAWDRDRRAYTDRRRGVKREPEPEDAPWLLAGAAGGGAAGGGGGAECVAPMSEKIKDAFTATPLGTMSHKSAATHEQRSPRASTYS